MTSIDAASGKDRGLRWQTGPRAHLLALAVLLGSLGIVIALWRVAYQRELEVSRQAFVQDAEAVAERVRQRMVKYELVLRGGASLFASIARPTPQQWRAYVENLDVEKRFPGMVGLGFAGYVSQAQMLAFFAPPGRTWIAPQTLQALGLRSFVPSVTACPGCGRTTSTTFQELAKQIDDYLRGSMPQWRERYPGVENLKVAVMGCIVNGPGESKHADIGISLPGTGEAPAAPVFIDGEKAMTLRGENIADDFVGVIDQYVARRYGGETA